MFIPLPSPTIFYPHRFSFLPRGLARNLKPRQPSPTATKPTIRASQNKYTNTTGSQSLRFALSGEEVSCIILYKIKESLGGVRQSTPVEVVELSGDPMTAPATTIESSGRVTPSSMTAFDPMTLPAPIDTPLPIVTSFPAVKKVPQQNCQRIFVGDVFFITNYV